MGLWQAITHRNMDYLWIDQETIDSDKSATVGLDQLNQKRLEDQKISQDEYERRRDQLTSWSLPDVDIGAGPGRELTQPDVSPWEGFQEGLSEGAGNIRKTLSSGINSIFGTAFKIIPWQVWVALLIYGALVLWPYLPKPRK